MKHRNGLLAMCLGFLVVFSGCDPYEGDLKTEPVLVDNDGDGVGVTDCDDNDHNVQTGCVAATQAPDVDGDGYSPAEGDCNDGSSVVHPNATELCNKIDDDCDDVVDEDLEDCDDESTPPPSSGRSLVVSVTFDSERAKAALNYGYCSQTQDGCEDWRQKLEAVEVSSLSATFDVGTGVFRINTAEDTDGYGSWDNWLFEEDGEGGCITTSVFKVTLDNVDVTSQFVVAPHETGGCDGQLAL